jgi:hypothetical protein
MFKVKFTGIYDDYGNYKEIEFETRQEAIAFRRDNIRYMRSCEIKPLIICTEFEVV